MPGVQFSPLFFFFPTVSSQVNEVRRSNNFLLLSFPYECSSDLIFFFYLRLPYSPPWSFCWTDVEAFAGESVVDASCGSLSVVAKKMFRQFTTTVVVD